MSENGFANCPPNLQNTGSFITMKNTVLSLIFLIGTVLFSACYGQNPAASTAPDAGILSSDKARESYALGMFFGQGWQKNGMDIDVDLLARAIKDSQSGAPTLLNQQQMIDALNKLRMTAAMYHQKAQQAEVQKNEQEGAVFLAQNRTQPGVVELPDGLQYKVIGSGQGPTPAPGDMVTVNYRGTSIDGTEFDSSAKAGHPVTFPVGGVIRGWTEALQKMTVGSKWELYVPSNLAYGSRGNPPVIGPDQTLIFDVELISTAPAPAPAPRQPLTSDIIRVPSAQEMQNGAKVETIKASDLAKYQQGATNQ
jgi:FKBP-type peptidyl-prolyl cis-trans isomerase FklB